MFWINFCFQIIYWIRNFDQKNNKKKIKIGNYIGSVMDSVLASSVIDCGYELRSCQTKEYKIGICCFSAKNAALRRKSKDWLTRNQNNVSEWSDISTQWLLLAHIRQCELLSSLRRLSSINYSHFNLLLWNASTKWSET